MNTDMHFLIHGLSCCKIFFEDLEGILAESLREDFKTAMVSGGGNV
jgi:hypothetical protein